MTLADLCENAYLVFYNNRKTEAKLTKQFGHNYTIDARVRDARRVLKNIENIHVVQVNIPKDILFPNDYEKIKKLVEERAGGVCDLQIFGSEERDIYVPYKYAADYILGSMYAIESRGGDMVSLHATLIRNDYENYKKYLPALVQETIDKNSAQQDYRSF
jgi:hypothetical protein